MRNFGCARKSVIFFWVQDEPEIISQRFWGRNLLFQIGDKIADDESSEGSTQFSQITGVRDNGLGDSSDGSTQFSDPTPMQPLVVSDSTSGEDFWVDSEDGKSVAESGRVVHSCSQRPEDYVSSDSEDFNIDDIPPRSQAPTQQLPDNFKALPEAR